LERRDDEETVVPEAIGDGDDGAATVAAVKKPVWLNKHKKGSKGKSKSKTVNNKQKAAAAAAAAATTSRQNEKTQVKREKSREMGDSDDDSVVNDSDNEDKDFDGSSENDNKNSTAEDDDMEWEKFQQKLNKREKLEGRSKLSHSVHCPTFPEDKQEYWWTYICDRKSRTLLTAPYHITNLVDHEEIPLKFTAPRWPGYYTFTVCLRSDSYMGMDQQQELKLDVKEAAAIPTEHPQWEISDSESEHNEQQGNESEFTTDTSDEEA